MADRPLDPDALARLHDAMAAHVDSGSIPGLVTLVARGDEVHVDVIGRPSLDSTAALQRDAIFRIASLTKPVTAAAAMILIDDGVLALDEPIDSFIPELANRRVLRSPDAELDDTVPAHRAITVDDLLTCRLGLGVVLTMPGSYPIQRAEADLELRTFGPPWPPPPFLVDEWTRRIGTLPLMHQPGEDWLYNTGIQVLGVLIERAAKQPFEAFLRERLFGPLGMVDTGFTLNPANASRFTTSYFPDPDTGALDVLDAADRSWWSQPALPNGAAWLLSTIDDYWSFASMLANGGTAHGTRVLSKAAIARMVMDHLHPHQRDAARPFVGAGNSWGFGMAVPETGARGPGEPPGYGWDGGSGTSWRTDPATGVTGILFTQRAMTSPEPPASFTDFFRGVHAAVARP
jgi:CubicO group peptidase (beta-lactamase class C family)